MKVIEDMTRPTRHLIVDIRDTPEESFTLRYMAAMFDDHHPNEIWITQRQQEILRSPFSGDIKFYRDVPMVVKE